MPCLMNVIAVAVIICRFAKELSVQAQVNVQDIDNAEQFALLCRIYNVAKNPPIHHVDLQDPNKILEDIDSINASLAEEKQFNETEQAENSSYAQAKLNTTREAFVAQALLNQITQKAHTILEEIKRVNATRDIETVKAEFAQVIFGEGGSESNLCQATVNDMDNRSKACGKPGNEEKGESAGKNLVVDFFCLCSRRTDADGVDQVCAVHVGGKGGHHGWSEKGPWGSSSMWATIKKGCGKLIHHHPKSIEEVQEVINDFLKHLEAGGLYRWGETVRNTFKGSNRKPGMLGTGARTESDERGKGILCDGKRGYTDKRTGQPPGGVCVYYGQESDWKNITWLKQLKTALDSLATLNNQTATIQRDIEKLQRLLHRAEKIYETAKVISDIQNPAVPTNLQTAVKRLTAYNAARSNQLRPFILLFVLI
ncbi:Variant surface glycoprotein [Trypanosoma congolense IL3000]|uniref:Variant surface glycoprotein n=1 Tax=Trypanosoma congolense (strain IL3000) TaxID=1068625 RepID=F9WGW7_TRYCI|nr:Variant surface glycoprotein [Trypanosoma congolense IL3000]